MGDRTFYRLALPPGLKRSTLRRVASAFTGDWWTKGEAAGLRESAQPDGTVWVDIEERLCGECREAAEAVLEALDGAEVAFTVTEDPKYDVPGTVCRYQPGRGMHEADCDATGTAVVTAGWVRGISETTEDPGIILSALRAELGLDWETPRAS